MKKISFIIKKFKVLIFNLIRKRKADVTFSEENNIGYETNFPGNKDSNFYRHN
jgi:hypothetical protein